MNDPTYEISATSRPVKAPLPSNLIRVPLIQQKQDFSCGAAATLLLMRYWCIDTYDAGTEGDLYEPLRTTRANGTEPEPMVELFRRSGLRADYRHGNVRIEDLERAVLASEPPIVDLQAWSDRADPWKQTWDAGHYVVMVGYDEDRLYFADPSRATPGGYAFLLRSELEDRWHDLSGELDTPLEHMAIFVSGTRRWTPPPTAASHATRLG
jgi:predicted double-glycine peptidase